jgi:ankyrin repeat protein
VNKEEVAKVKVLLAKDPSLVNAQDSSGATAMHKAAFVGNAAIVKVLIDSGADVNIKDQFGETPLKQAEFFGRDEVAAMIRKAAAKGSPGKATPGNTAIKGKTILPTPAKP